MPIINPSSGEIRQAQIFVGVLGASDYSYAEVTLTQSLPDWLGSHVRMCDYFGGTSAIIVPDNLRSDVSTDCPLCLKQSRSILHCNRDRLPEQLDLVTDLPQDDANIRGPENFH